MDKIDLKKLKACKDAISWFEEQQSNMIAWENCHRGDWMLWIARRLKIDNKVLTLAKAHCAATVRHLMNDTRSKNAIIVSFRYSKGKATQKELNYAAAAAAAAAADDDDDADAAAADDADAAAAYAAYAAADAYADADDDAAAAADDDDDAAAADDDDADAADDDDDADAAAAAAAADADDAAAAAYAAAAYAAAAVAYAAADDAADDAADALSEIRIKQADICRKVLTKEVFEKLENYISIKNK